MQVLLGDGGIKKVLNKEIICFYVFLLPFTSKKKTIGVGLKLGRQPVGTALVVSMLNVCL